MFILILNAVLLSRFSSSARSSGNALIMLVISCTNAALNGHSIESLIWAREKWCPWDENTCSKAAQNGNIEMLKWARGKLGLGLGLTRSKASLNSVATKKSDNGRGGGGCPWDKLTWAQNGHPEVLTWARGYQCPWDERTCVWANENGKGQKRRALSLEWRHTCSKKAENGHF